MKVCRFSTPVWRFLSDAGGLMCTALRGYHCFVLHRRSIDRLVRKFPPRFSQIHAEHITSRYGVGYCEQLPDVPQEIEVVGYFCDDSLECVSVTVGGVLGRSDGNLYHITLSTEPHRRPEESNELIARAAPKPCCGLFLSAVPVFRLIKSRKEAREKLA
jgi:hypothetical protein